MKKKNKIRILPWIITLSLIALSFILFFDTYLRLQVSEFICSYWKRFIDQKSWTIQTLVAIIGVLLLVYYEEKNRKSNKQKVLQPKPLSPPIFEIKKYTEMEKIVNLRPFIENQAIGNTVGSNKSWKDLKNEIEFSEFKPLDLTSNHSIYFISGKFGIGKSTYMLTLIEEYLRRKKPIFTKIIFLDPSSYDQWADALKDYSPKTTLLVLDALYRITDKTEFEKRCKCLIKLTKRLVFEDTTVGPFKILITIRSDELVNLLSMWVAKEIHDSYFNYIIEHTNLNLRKITTNYIKSYNVKINIPEDKKDIVINQLISKSEGSPFYLRHFFISLKNDKEKLSEERIEQCPTGVINLIWQTIEKRFYIPSDKVIPFLLLLYTSINNFFSTYFINFLIEKRGLNKDIDDIKSKINGLSIYFQSYEKIINNRNYKYYNINSNWETSILSAFHQENNVLEEYRTVLSEYKTIYDCEYNTLHQEISCELQNHLQGGFKNIADVFLCIDLARLSEENLYVATEIYTKFYSLSTLPQDYLKYIQEELYGLWISDAWRYRAIHNIDKTITCYENAFDKLGVRNDKKQLSGYAYFIKKYKLPELEFGIKEFNECIEKTENLYKEVIKLDLEDEISWQAFALFYKDQGKYEDAEKCFKKALTIGPNHIPAIQAFAIFYLDKGKLEWVNDRNMAIEYYKKAEQQFKNAITKLENESKMLQPDKFSEIEKRLFNAYAKYLIDKTEWCNEYEERIKIDEEIDEILDKLVNKYPGHGQSITVYAQFLLSYAKILPKYKKGKNCIKAVKLLNEYIGENKNQKELSYFMALHVLAIYYYKYKPLHNKQSIDFNKVEKLLIESSNSFNPKHNSIAFNELGKLYVRWASSLRHNELEYNQTMNNAKIAYENAMKIHGNIETALHLSKVYFNYAFYLQYLKKDPSEYIKKALEIAHKFTYIPFTFYYYLTNIGDEMINDGEFDQAMTVLKEAIKIGKSHKIDYGYSLWKLGEVYREKKDLEEAVNIYYEYAQSQNTSEGYIARRNSIKKLMHDNAITKNSKTTFYNRCITICNEFSEKNYNIKKTLRSCQDYGEDLLEVGQIQLAISIFNQGISIISNSEDLDESKKVKSLSIFYMNLGFCYKYLNDFTNAEINFEVIAKTLNSAYGYLKTSILLYDLNLYEKTLYYFNQFVESYPNTNDDQKKNIYFEISSGFQKYAECLEQINKISESVAYWKDYADLSYYFNPKSGARVYGIIGNNLMGRKMYVDAREYLIKSLRLDQDKEQKAKNFSRLGIINEKLFKWEEACICFENALKLRYDNRDKTNLYNCNNEFNSVIKDYDEMDVDHIISAAIILELKNEYDLALEKYNNALAILQPYDIKVLSNVSKLRFIADAFFVLGEKDMTLELYENTITDMVTGIEKSVVEAIIWFIYNDEDFKKQS